MDGKAQHTLWTPSGAWSGHETYAGRFSFAPGASKFKLKHLSVYLEKERVGKLGISCSGGINLESVRSTGAASPEVAKLSCGPFS